MNHYLDNDLFLATFARVASKDEFKSIFRRVVQDEIFWRQLLDDNRFNYRIDSKLDNFRTSVMSSVDSRVDNKVRDNLSYSLPGQVSKELGHQMPGYLNNNHQMNLILDSHSEKLQDELENVARVLLERIVAEDQYHEINKMYFDAFKTKYNTAISNFVDNGDKTIRSIQNKYRNDIRDLTDNLSKVREQSQKINNLEDDLKKLNKYSETLHNYIYGLLGMTVGIIGVIAFKVL